MDSAPESVQTAGPTPKELILQALAGCTMMNVAAIITKSRKKLERFWIETDAKISSELPYAFESIRLIYNLIGENLDPDFVANAIKLSLEKYCSVSAMLNDSVKVSYDFKILSPQTEIGAACM